MPDTAEAIFARHRARVFAVAYRLTGSVSDAEDVVQETWLRWSGIDVSDIRAPEAWLTTAAGRLGLDQLRRTKARRETYIGPWLPEPIVEASSEIHQPTPEENLSLADDISIALLHMLERLAPEERAAFLLHEAFDYGYGELATLLGKSEAACRQIVSRARRRVADERPRFNADLEEHERLAAAFSNALAQEDPKALLSCFREDAVLYSDGGGKAAAALNPIYSDDHIARFFAGIQKKYSVPLDPMLITVNGGPGFALLHDGKMHSIMSVDIKDGQIATVYMMRNPDKLARASATLGIPLYQM
ncbi:MAG: sigma-70 family RNA polymerase sigma factor [Parvibaculum sp.]|uniref:sigma-70 family RNA polymerase sigma factor n=1 Tax=Parvibaculum sp. TaxID=2024848 RepID=UPI0025F4A965|nr:sigma-70 family RNA polymerase sigma factor [Parvibaculum sp.]MCE9651366.1 sigma-70 family RNA polymerase sigma factor [Parvibaculum sp.]